MSGKVFILGYLGLAGVVFVLLSPMPQAVTAPPKAKPAQVREDYLPAVTPEPVYIEQACRKVGKRTEYCTVDSLSARDIADAAAALTKRGGIYVDQLPPDWRRALGGDEP